MVLAVSGPLVIGVTIVAALVLLAVLLRAEEEIEREEDESQPTADS